MDKNFLPHWLYEALRWLSAVLLPGIAALISALNGAWLWGLPIEAILTTFAAVETFIGVVFLGSKIATDCRNGE